MSLLETLFPRMPFRFIKAVFHLKRLITEDIQCVLSRDPAARSRIEVMLCYAGLHAVWGYRVAHWYWLKGHPLIARVVSQCVRFWTGVEIHPAAKIGRRLLIDHGMGVVIGETARVGSDVTLYHGATLGGKTLERGQKRHPTLEDGVVIGAGAKVLGNICVGACSQVGANAVVTKSVPPNSVALGIPAQHRPIPMPEVHDEGINTTLHVV
ncbi:MAG: serine O-acetyltransferase [Vampirovibrionales bacterium]